MHYAGETLYDWSGVALAGNELQVMCHYQRICRHLVAIFESFTAHSTATTESGKILNCFILISCEVMVKLAMMIFLVVVPADI